MAMVGTSPHGTSKVMVSFIELFVSSRWQLVIPRPRPSTPPVLIAYNANMEVELNITM